MSPNPVRLAMLSPDALSTRKVLARGGRVWAFRDVDGSSLGDRLVTLPGLKGEVVVLAPRGFGRPLLAKQGPTGWRGLASGEPCAAERWVEAGAVAAWLHAAGAPYRPGPLLALGIAGVGATVVVVLRARGLLGEERQAEALRLMEGASLRSTLPDGLLLEVSGSDSRLLMARLERVSLRLRPALPDLRIAAAATEGAALALSEGVEAGWVGMVPESAMPAWEQAPAEEGTGTPVGIHTERRVGRWKGPAVPDIDGVVGLCRSMTLDLPPAPLGGMVRVGLHGEKGFCFFRVECRKGASPSQLAGQVAAAVCEHFFQVGAVHAMSVALVEEVQRASSRTDVRAEAREGSRSWGQLALLPEAS